MEENNIIIYNTEDGKDYNVTFYSLDMILTIGFRVGSEEQEAEVLEELLFAY